MFPVMPGDFDPPIDSVKAQKALECVEKIAAVDNQWWPGDMDEDGVLQIHELLKQYGFVS
jgi:hypothetical protein